MAEIKRKIARQRDADVPKIDDGVRILELANRAAELFEQQEMVDKKMLVRNADIELLLRRREAHTDLS